MERAAGSRSASVAPRPIRVRQAQAGDIEGLCLLRNHRRLFQDYLDRAARGRSEFLVAVLDDCLAGFASVYLAPGPGAPRKSHYPKVSDVWVGQSWRRRGVGSALVNACESRAGRAGLRDLFVSVDPVESPGMLALLLGRRYEPLQSEPYLVTATFHGPDGEPYSRTYGRIDLRKALSV